MSVYKTYMLPAIVDPLWITKENPLAESEDILEKEEQELAKFYASITNFESTFMAPGFERKEESEEEEEGGWFCKFTKVEEMEVGDDSERELEEYADDLHTSSIANNNDGSIH